VDQSAAIEKDDGKDIGRPVSRDQENIEDYYFSSPRK